MKLSQARFALLLLVGVMTFSGCGVVNRIRAKNELNEAARTYREGKFAEAEQHSRRALELDPDNTAMQSKLADLYLSIRKRSEAIPVLEEIVRDFPDRAGRKVGFARPRPASMPDACGIV